MYSCKEVVEQASHYTENQLKWHERFAYRLHLMMCRHCQRFVKQFRLMVQSFSKIKWQEDTLLNEEIINTIQSKNLHLQGDDHEK